MKTKSTNLFFSGFVFGLLFWLLSPVFLNKYEPWDYSLILYLIVIIIAGFIFGATGGRQFWIAAVGLYIGQYLVSVFRPEPFAAIRLPLYIGSLSMAILTLPLLLSGFMGWGLKVVFRRMKHDSCEIKKGS